MRKISVRPAVTGAATRRRGVVLAAVLAVAAGAGLAASVPAQAAAVSIDNAVFRWSMNKEAHAGGFAPGTCNFFVAGTVGNVGSSRAWTAADGFYKATDGNVSLVRPNASGQYVAPTWANVCKDRNGTTLAAGSPTSWSEEEVVITGGAGTVDPATGTATISWTGSWTIAFYSGMTYWTAANPVLTVNADGTGTVTATASGYGTSMEDQSEWAALAPRQITLANLSGVDVDADGFSVTPAFLGVATNLPTSYTGSPQVAKYAGNEGYWGSFPQSFVDFQTETGQTSYWLSSGGTADQRKPTTPLSVAYTLDGSTPAEPTPSGPSSPAPQPGANQQSVTVTVAELAEPGEFVFTIPGNNAVTMTNPTYEGNSLRSTGALSPIQVTDMRAGGPAWSVSGQVGDFTGGLPGKLLGWTPKVPSSGIGAVPGATVASGITSGNGLRSSSVLASAPAGHALGSATLGADLDLRLPPETAVGTYTALLTLTAVA